MTNTTRHTTTVATIEQALKQRHYVGMGSLADRIRFLRLLKATQGHGMNNVRMDRRVYGLG